ncbi:hypothetical protein FZC74_05105 [Sutcliffiella horikoshii]|uniref:Uncharacterized protein n=1 Tax=Sutcliffiella horikoshii TaxID=79883 RepID=A0AA94WS96_9BACI|nr:hypothetical protein FZC74_05105 [Sutcliffiella horikoshii]
MQSLCRLEWKARRRPREEGTGETPQRSEEAHGPPAGKRSAWNGNHQFSSFLIYQKEPKLPNKPWFFLCIKQFL